MRIRWDGSGVVIDSPHTGNVVWRLEPGGIPTAAWEADVRAAAMLYEVALRDVNRVVRHAERYAGEMATGGGHGRDAHPAIRTPPAAEPDFVGPEP